MNLTRTWRRRKVDEKLTEKYGDKAEAVKEAFLEAYPERALAMLIMYPIVQVTSEHWQKRLASGDTKNYNYLVSYEFQLTVGKLMALWRNSICIPQCRSGI